MYIIHVLTIYTYIYHIHSIYNILSNYYYYYYYSPIYPPPYNYYIQFTIFIYSHLISRKKKMLLFLQGFFSYDLCTYKYRRFYMCMYKIYMYIIYFYGYDATKVPFYKYGVSLVSAKSYHRRPYLESYM